MKTYKQEQAFSRRTGKPDGYELVEDQVIDDFTGEVIDTDNHEVRPLYTATFKYDSGCEQDWYYDEIDDLVVILARDLGMGEDEFDEYHIRRVLAEGEFHFNWDMETQQDTSVLLMHEFAKSRVDRNPDAESIFDNCGSFAQCCRVKRKEIVMRLLKEKKFTAEQLGLIEI